MNIHMTRREVPIAVMEAVADWRGIDQELVWSRHRGQHVAATRHMAYFILNKLGFSQREMAPLLGRDRTTVLYGIHKIQDELEIYGSVKKELEALFQHVRETVPYAQLVS